MFQNPIRLVVILPILFVMQMMADSSFAGVIHAYATAQVPEFGTTPGTIGFSRVDQMGEISATATTRLTRRGFRTAYADARLLDDKRLRLGVSGEGNRDGYGASAGWKDTFRISQTLDLDEVLFHVYVHGTYNQTPGFGIGRSMPGQTTADLSVASVTKLAGVHRPLGSWSEILQFSDSAFSGVAVLSSDVVDHEVDFSLFFTATESIGTDYTYFDGRSTATLLRVTDVDGNEIQGSFASGMLPANATQATVPEPSSFACFGIGVVVTGLTRRRKARKTILCLG